MSAIELLPSFTGYEVGDIYAEAELNGETLYRGRSRKALGELGELAFSYKAASLGFGVPNPWARTNPLTSSSTPATAYGECRSNLPTTCARRTLSVLPAPTSAENAAVILTTTLT